MISLHKIKLTVWSARFSHCMIKLNKRDMEYFKENILPDLQKLGFVGMYNKEPYRRYYLNQLQHDFLLSHPDCEVRFASEKWHRDNN